MIEIRERENGLTISCYVTPKSSKTKIRGERDGALTIALTAPPTDGRANKELIEFLSKILKVPKSNISIIKGEGSRKKVVFVRGISKNELRTLEFSLWS